MGKNICLVKAYQFFHQFWLVVWYKSGKEYIILDTLSRLVNIKNIGYDILYLEFDTLFIYYITLIKINLELVKCILENYAANN